MKIRKFTENVDSISTDRINEIINTLKSRIVQIEDYNLEYEKLISELNNYRDSSTKGNDQIDDSIFALQVIRRSIDDVLEKSDTIINNLISYSDEGRKYLYTEDK